LSAALWRSIFNVFSKIVTVLCSFNVIESHYIIRTVRMPPLQGPPELCSSSRSSSSSVLRYWSATVFLSFSFASARALSRAVQGLLLLRTQVLLRLSLSIYCLRLSLSFFSLCVLSRRNLTHTHIIQAIHSLLQRRK
jgi:hypothetical protein